MAERRMLAKKIVNDDSFIQLSASAQALYLHLVMSADDDGFSKQITLSLFKAHASVSDLQTLIENGYIYQFGSGTIVIVHWRMANSIRKDRHTPTIYQEEFAQLKLQNNGVYIWSSEGCRKDATCQPQDSSGEDSSGEDSSGEDRYNNDSARNQHAMIQPTTMQKDNSNTAICPFFEELWAIYPNQKGKNKITEAALIKMKEIGHEAMVNAVKAYKEEVADTDIKYIKHGNTFFNGDFEGYLGRSLQEKEDVLLSTMNIVPVFNVQERSKESEV